MTNQDTYRIPAKLIRKHGTRSPFILAQELGVHVMKRSDFDRQKGAFALVLNVPFIFINDHLSDEMQRIVCAHELGHALLHRKLCRESAHQAIYELELFDIRDNTEYEANVFAANLLIDEDEMLEYLKQGYDVVETARALDTNINLLMIKMIEMKDRDDIPVDIPYIPGRDFLGSISDDAGGL